MPVDWLQELRECCRSEEAFQTALSLIAKAGVSTSEPAAETRETTSFLPPRVIREQLQNNHAFISEVLHTQSGLVLVLDRETRIVLFNHACERLSGYAAAEVFERTFWEVFQPETGKAEVDQWFAEIVRQKNPTQTKHKIHRKSGRARYVEWAVSVLLDNSGEVEHIVVTGKDVTEQTIIEEATRLLSSAIEYTSETIIVGKFETVDKLPIIQLLNPSGTKLTGFTDPEVDKKRLDVLFGNGDGLGSLCKSMEDVRQGRSVSLELPLFRKDGSEIIVKGAVSPVFDDDNRVTHYVMVVHDTTEQNRIERELIEREQLYRELVELSTTAITVHCDGKIVFINQFGAELIGAKSPEEVIGKPALLFVHPSSVPAVAVRLKMMMETGQRAPLLEETFVKLDGTPFFVETTASPIMFQGKLAIQTISRDITERLKQQKALEESEQRLHLALQGANQGVWDWNAKTGDVTNLGWAEILQYTPEEFAELGGKWRQFIHPNDIEQLQSKLNDHIAGLTPHYECEYRVLDRTGEWRWILARGQVVEWDENGAAIRIAGTRIDITRLKRIEEALVQSSEKYRTLFQSANDAIMIMDGDRFTDVNPKALEIFGRSIEDIVSSTPWDLSPEYQPSGVTSKELGERYIETCLAGKQLIFEWQHIRKDGRPFDAEVSLSRLELNGVPYLQAIVRDITEWKSTVAELQESEKRYRSIVHAIGDYSYVLRVLPDERVDFEWASDTVLAILKTSAGALTVDLLKGVIHQDDVKQFIGKLNARIAGNTCSGEFRIVLPSGEVRWLRDIGVPVKNARTGAVERIYCAAHDITDQMVMWEKISESEQRYRRLFEEAPIGLWEFDGTEAMNYVRQVQATMQSDLTTDSPELRETAKGIVQRLKILGVNNAAIALYRAPNKEELLANFSANLISFDYEQLKEAIIALLSGKRHIEFESVIHTPWIPDAIHVHITANLSDNYRLLLGFVDITELKHALEKIRQSEEKFSLVFHATPDVYTVTTLQEGLFIDVNNAFLAITGYAREEVIGKTTLDLKVWKNWENRTEVVDKLLRDRSIQNLELQMQMKSGEVLDFLFSAEIIQLNDQEYMLSLFHDITERKKSERQVYEANARFQWVVENAPAVAIKGFTQDGRICRWNRYCQQLYGYSAGEAIGKQLGELLFYPEDAAEFEQLLARIWETGESAEAQSWRVHDKSGKELWILSSLFPIVIEENVLEVFGMDVDITERKRLEEERLRTQKLESLGILAGGIAHDFNNLLTGIVGSISFAKLFPDSREDSEKLLEEAERTALRAKDLTHQLLTFAKGGEPVRKNADLARIIKDIVPFSLRGSKSTYQMDLASDLYTVEVDEGQIGQVFQNLVINSSQAMPSGGTIRVTGRNLTENDPLPSQLTPGNYVSIAISDNGVGISEEYLTRIFDPYFTTKQSGSGLGLATVHSIVLRHDGWVSVESRVGVGTTFTIYLPAATSQLVVTQRVEDVIQSGKGRVLVLDDEEIIRTLLKRILEHLGYDAVTTSEGAETIRAYEAAKAAGTPFDLVIMDLTIPGGMGGVETIHRLLAIDPLAKAIVSSGYSNDPVMANYRKYGFSGVVAKPYVLKEISQVVSEVMKKQPSVIVAD